MSRSEEAAQGRRCGAAKRAKPLERLRSGGYLALRLIVASIAVLSLLNLDLWTSESLSIFADRLIADRFASKWLAAREQAGFALLLEPVALAFDIDDR